MLSDSHWFVSDRRAVSEVVGVTLLLGIVFLAALVTLVFGSSIIEDVQGQNKVESSKLVLQEFDSRVSVVSHDTTRNRTRFDPGSVKLNEFTTNITGNINITVNRNALNTGSGPRCQADVPLASIRSDTDDGGTIAYEAGGVWRTSREGTSAMLSSPDLSFQDGSLSVTVTNVTGTIDESYTSVVLNGSGSAAKTAAAMGQLTHEECVRPDNITLKVESSFYQAWGKHLETELTSVAGSHKRVATFDANETALAYVDQKGLPRRTDDSRNQVVNLSWDGSHGTANIVRDKTDGVPPYIQFDKSGVSNTYQVTMRPVTHGQFHVGNETVQKRTIGETTKPRDVVYVLDTSTSMADRGKMGDAQDAAKESLSVLSEADRAGVMPYAEGAHGPAYFYIGLFALQPYTGEYSHNKLTANFDALKTSFDRLDTGGNTCINCGINASRRIFSLESNRSRNKTMLVMSDGKNGDTRASDQATRAAARLAAQQGITVHTAAFGGGADESLLQDVANIGGGEFRRVDNGEELRDFFRDSLTRPVTEDRIQLTPATTNLTIGGGAGQAATPSIPGDADSITGDGPFLNVNDPTAPGRFRIRSVAAGGQRVYLNATWHSCTDRQILDVKRGGQTVTRCADLNENNPHNVSEQNTTMYLDGYDAGPADDSAPGARLLQDKAPDWQRNMTEKLQPILDDQNNLDLESNQALVVYNYSLPGENSRYWNRLPVIYEIGRSEAEARPQVIDVQIRDVVLGGEAA